MIECLWICMCTGVWTRARVCVRMGGGGRYASVCAWCDVWMCVLLALTKVLIRAGMILYRLLVMPFSLSRSLSYALKRDSRTATHTINLWRGECHFTAVLSTLFVASLRPAFTIVYFGENVPCIQLFILHISFFFMVIFLFYFIALKKILFAVFLVTFFFLLLWWQIWLW